MVVREQSYAPHRHDTYVFALTLSGAQCFDYRGVSTVSVPGQLVVLHPDEKHDGRAGTDDGFRYRGVAINPADLRPALGSRPLPFIASGVCDDAELIGIIGRLLGDLTAPIGKAEYDDCLVDLADRLCLLEGKTAHSGLPDIEAVRSAHALILATPHRVVGMDELEAETGQNRWQLSRDFKAVYGTSPYRFGQLRRLDRARQRLRGGGQLADIACAEGFADQSHFTRQFKQTFGVSPGRWQAMAA